MNNLDIQPIQEFIEPFKRKSRVHYGFQGYFTTQPFNVVSAYINNFSRKGELIFDPFVGSGVTAVESLRNYRKVSVIDLNPFAIFLTKTKCSYINIPEFNSMFENIVRTIEDECKAINNLSTKELEKLEIPYWYPKNIKLPSDADVDFLHDIFSKKQLYHLSLIYSEIDKLTKSDEKDLMLMLFCATLSRANLAYDLPDDGRSQNAGQFTIFSTGRYRIPKNRAELIPLEVFKRRYKNMIKAKEETNKIFKNFVNNKNFQARVGSATDLKSYIKDSTVDYIYTDPPYGGHIAYLDLSIVYNEWLKLKVTKKMKQLEVIEGGEINHSMDEYKNLLKESLSEMSRVLKPNRWLSLVFHHREPSLWTNIVETAKSVGLEYRNSVVQHTKLPSWHKIDVPQTVLSSQMIINFIRKKHAYFAITDEKITLNQLILNVAEREIIKRHSATLEEIINSLVPELFEHNYIYEEAQTTTDKIYNFLCQEFDYNLATKTFSIKQDKHKKLGSYIPLRDRVKYYIISYMKLKRKATLEEILPAILPKLINGETPSGEQILDELKKIASFDGKHWVFYSGDMQTSFDFDKVKETPIPYKKGEIQIPNISEHDKIIYILSLLAIKYGLVSKVGQKEQQEPFLKAISAIPNFNSDKLSKKHISNIDNIDCMWFSPKSSSPLFAFEVEHTTQITTAFERFISLLKYDDDIGNQRRLVLVISHKNKNKFNTLIKESSYIGAPHYLNNKIRFIFEEKLLEYFESLMNENNFMKFEGLLSNPELG